MMPKGKKKKVKIIGNRFNEITAECMPHLEKAADIHVQEAYRTPNRPKKTLNWV